MRKKSAAAKRRRTEKKSKIRRDKRRKKQLIYQISRTIKANFPNFYDQIREIDDSRKKESIYELTALVISCIAMFLFKTGSRNEFNNLRDDPQFKENYEKLFNLPMPHPDTMDRVIKLLDTNQIEKLKQKLVQQLIKRKMFHKSRYRGKWFTIAIDGSGVVSFSHKHCDQCLHKTTKDKKDKDGNITKKGKTTYFHNVMEARLVTSNGFSISLATEWIENPEDGDYDKQDCERKAFLRLAKKLKKAFPRLPIMILADGLYPYQGFFGVCQANNWAYQVTFKDGNLPTVWQEVEGLGKLQIDNKHQEVRYLPGKKKKPLIIVKTEYRWVTEIDYKGYSLNWLECKETITKNKGTDEEKITIGIFTHITDLPLNRKNISKTSANGRMRWKIENEGFNTLKNGGYNMSHKYARKSYQGMKNYYQLMQIAYCINQLMVKTIKFTETYLKGKNHKTLKSIWSDLISAMKWATISVEIFKRIEITRTQFRFVT